MTVRCKTCKHWLRGTITQYAPDAKVWSGDKPHPRAGKTVINRPRWQCHDDDQDVGECAVASRGQDGKHAMIVGTCDNEGIYGEVVTDAEFGCILHEPAPEDWDHYNHEKWP